MDRRCNITFLHCIEVTSIGSVANITLRKKDCGQDRLPQYNILLLLWPAVVFWLGFLLFYNFLGNVNVSYLFCYPNFLWPVSVRMLNSVSGCKMFVSSRISGLYRIRSIPAFNPCSTSSDDFIYIIYRSGIIIIDNDDLGIVQDNLLTVSSPHIRVADPGGIWPGTDIQEKAESNPRKTA